METVSSITSAASRAIWGTGSTDPATDTTGKEPISGETGNVDAGEPYDKGNIEHVEDTTASKSSPAAETSGPNPTTDLPGNTPTTLPIRSEHETDKTGVTSHHNPVSATSFDKPTSSNEASGPGAVPSIGSKPVDEKDGDKSLKHQGADRPEEGVEQGTDEHSRIKETKNEAEDAAKVNISGPGPKTLEEKAHDKPTTSAGGDDDGPQKESHGKGTGEKYVKSSGLKADGGDFDAANPGAGKEADRLLEEKGISHTTGTPKANDSKESSKEDVTTGKEKLSLKDKIKAKMHRNKDSKDS